MNKETPILVNYQKKGRHFEDLCNEHHIGGLLYFRYKEFRSNKVFKTHWLRQWHRNEVLEGELKKLGPELSQKNIIPTLLKGMSLVGTIYKDYGSRFMSDIDLLCDSSEKLIIEDCLSHMGYTLLKTQKWSANSHKSEWNKIVDGIEVTIELHTNLYYHISPSPDIPTIESHIPGFHRLSIEDELVFLCTHYSFQHTYLKNFWLFDIYLFMDHYNKDINWDEVKRKAREYKVFNSISSCLNIIKVNFNFTSPLKTNHSLLTFLLTQNFLWSNNRRSLQYIMVKALCKDSLSEAMSYNLKWLFLKIKNRVLNK